MATLCSFCAQVGVGVGSAKEVINAVQSAGKDAKKNLVKVPITRNFSFPHRIDGEAGAAKVMLRPASEGTGVIAGGAVRIVLELAGIKNAFGKQLGSGNPLNNARATVDGLSRMRTFEQVAELRGLTVSELMGFRKGKSSAALSRWELLLLLLWSSSCICQRFQVGGKAEQQGYIVRDKLQDLV